MLLTNAKSRKKLLMRTHGPGPQRQQQNARSKYMKQARLHAMEIDGLVAERSG